MVLLHNNFPPISDTFSDSPFFYDRHDLFATPDNGRIQEHSKPKVAYHHPLNVGSYHYGAGHPMVPHRLTLTNDLVLGYGLHEQMDVYAPRKATKEELVKFHSADYIDFLERITPQSLSKLLDQNLLSLSSSLLTPTAPVPTYNMSGEDCPAFTGLFAFCRAYTGASLAAAKRLGDGLCEIAVNWSGGLHHAKKAEASGFCYVNDINLAILELLRVHARVLYIDIDIHHGDGVQEAFYHTPRVLTVSFHKYDGQFFPGTGNLSEIGSSAGRQFSLNVPLRDGIDDESYVGLFKAVMEPTIRNYHPESIVLQCGADSLGSDRLGTFNLSIQAHGECVRFIKSFNLPLLVLGGGGYRQTSVARCWTYETSVLTNTSLPSRLPTTQWDAYFPGMSLHPPLASSIENQNTRQDLEAIRRKIMEQLRVINGAPSVQMCEIPPSLTGEVEDEGRSKEEEDEERNGTGGAGERRLGREGGWDDVVAREGKTMVRV